MIGPNLAIDRKSVSKTSQILASGAGYGTLDSSRFLFGLLSRVLGFKKGQPPLSLAKTL